MFSPSELAEMRRHAEAAMPSGARIQDAVRTRDAGGSVSRAWSTVTLSPCFLAPESGTREERERSGQQWARGTWRVILPAATPVDLTQRIIVDGETDGTAWRKILSVVGIAGPHDYEVKRRVSCDETEAEPGEVIP